jgi:hypothetical protein
MDSPTKPKIGRPFLPPEKKLLMGPIRLNQQQWQDFHALGGVTWLRQAIKRAIARKGIRENERELS